MRGESDEIHEQYLENMSHTISLDQGGNFMTNSSGILGIYFIIAPEKDKSRRVIKPFHY